MGFIFVVIPAQAGIQPHGRLLWIPGLHSAPPGMTRGKSSFTRGRYRFFIYPKFNPMPITTQPLTVEVIRADLVESRHRISAVVADASGKVLHAWGDPERVTYPRSSSKPLQALPTVVSGAADHFNLSEREVALSCASHNSEPAHTSAVEAWLKRIGLGDDALECGPHWPIHEDSGYALARNGGEPCALHNNCSGKHSGFLTLAQFRGHDPANYISPHHPVQVEIRAALERLCELSLENAPCAIDGCSVPNWGLPLRNFAQGLARLATGETLPEDWQAAAQRIHQAMSANAFYVAGTGRSCTKVMDLFKGRLISKGGAEGVNAASIPELGVGVALKTEDGTGRAAEVALVEVLSQIGMTPDDTAAWDELREPIIRNRRGFVTGKMRCVEC